MGAQGTATLNFGAAPGTFDTTVAVTGQAAILAGSLVEAWVFPLATADHSADEHMLETLKVVARDVVAGTGFTIYGWQELLFGEPNLDAGALDSGRTGNKYGFSSTLAPRIASSEGKAHRIYGQWSVAWVWN